MKHKTTIYTTLTLVFIIIFNTIFPVSAANNNSDIIDYDIQIKAFYNLASTQRIVVENENMRLENNSYIELTAINVSNNYFEGFGKINCNSPFCFVFNGDLETKIVDTISNGIDGETTTAMIGIVTGCVIETGERITLSIHAIPEYGYSYIFVSVGTISETETSKTYIFGTVFDEMSQMINTSVVYSTPTNTIADDIVVNPQSQIATTALADYDEQFQGTAYSYYRKGLTDEVLPMVAVSLYTPNRVVCNSVYSAYVKINASVNNMLICLKAKYYGVINASYTSGTCSLYAPADKSTNEFLKLSDPDPENENFKVTLNVPSWVLGSASIILDIIPVTFNIYLKTIKVELSKNAGTRYDNKVVWNHNYSRNLTWTDSSPAQTSNGYTGSVDISYRKNENVGQTFTLSATGNVDFSFTGNDAGVPFNGTGTFVAPTITKTIYIDSIVS